MGSTQLRAVEAAAITGEAELALARTLRLVRDGHVELPVVLFSYYNPLLQYGLDRLAGKAGQFLIPDKYAQFRAAQSDPEEILGALRLLEALLAAHAPAPRIERSPDAAAISRTAAGWKGAGETAPLVAVPLSIVRDIALLSSGAEAAIMNEDLGELLRPVAARKSPDGWTRALRELLAMSRMPPQAQKPLMLEAFLFGLHGKE